MSPAQDQFRAGKRLWTSAEDAIMRRCYPDLPNTEIAALIRRTILAIYQRAEKLGLRKSAAYLASPHACRLRRGDHVGAPYRFTKGHVPANKGLRRPGWSRGRMTETQFQKGRRSGMAAQHHMAIGSTRLVDGYVYRKVSDVPNVPYTVNWKPEHHLVWVEARGPIPTGHALRFQNGDRSDVRIDNLELISRRQLMARNTIHNLPKPLKDTVMLLGAVNRQIRRRTDRAEQHR